VRENKIYVPTYEDVRLRPCPDPPAKSELIKLVEDAAKKIDKNMGFVTIEKKTRYPDKKWLLQVLSTLDSESHIFKKSYVAPLKPPEEQEQPRYQVDDCNFYADLPPLVKKKDLKSSGRSALT